MDWLKEEIGEDIYGIIDEFSRTVLLHNSTCARVPILRCHAKLRIYLDSINSPCVKRFYLDREKSPCDIEDLITPVEFLNDTYLKDMRGNYLYKKSSNYVIALGQCSMEYDLSDGPQLLHSHVIDYFEKYVFEYKGVELKYVPNHQKITKFMTDSIRGRFSFYMFLDYDQSFKTYHNLTLSELDDYKLKFSDKETHELIMHKSRNPRDSTYAFVVID